MLKSKLLVTLLIIFMGVTALRAGDSSFVKQGLIITGSITTVTSVGLIMFDSTNKIGPKAIPGALGITLIITGLFHRNGK